MKKIIAVALLALILIIIMAESAKNQKGRVCFKDKCFNVDLAITLEEKIKGLMHRKNMKGDEGMLFIHEDENTRGFWMKNVNFPLDIIWMDKDKKVVFINKNTPICLGDPCPVVKPDVKAKYVLELKGGISDDIGLKIGDELILYKQE